MTCQDFLPWLESGDPANVRRAKLHGQSCAACREAERILAQVKQELTASEPLPERLKLAFVNAAESAAVRLPSERHDRKDSRVSIWLAALAAGIVIAAAILFAGKARDRETAQE